VSENSLIYLKYESLEDMLKVIIYSAQSMIGMIPMLYHIEVSGHQIMFIQTGSVGGVTIHYVLQAQKPPKKFIQLKRLSGEFSFVEGLGTDSQSLYVPILNFEMSTLSFLQ
jgi:hypothetical protein